MALKKDLSVVKKGMQKDKHPSQLEQQEYVYAMNANLSNESGNYINISNEHSNILSSKFKDGYRVIGFKNDITSNNTYFFLTNPITNVSEFGYIAGTQNIQNLSDIEVQCDTCDFKNVLAEPLETITQVPSQTYVTLLSDCDGNKCFNFSILHPIKKIEIKTEKVGKTIYFTDNLNPPRYIQLENLEIYAYEGEEVCGDDSGVIPTCLACEKMRIFRRFDIPNMTPETIVLGGRLLPGTYEFLVAYTDSIGNEISEYYSITNPITIFDPNNVVTPGAQRTNFAIKLNISGLDKDYSYYKVAVIQTNTFQETSYFEEGVHAINDTTILYTTEQDKRRTDLNNLLRANIHVELWEGLTQSNGYLFGYGITVTKEVNLQPVVNLMGAFLRWQTHIAKENLYEDGVANSLFKGYHRDETYSFGIRFSMNDGYTTALFPFIGRPATSEEREGLPDNNDANSIQYINDSCIENGITERWQLYNTATLLGVCELGNEIPTNTITEDVSKTCYVPDISTAPADDFIISLGQGQSYTNLYDFIEANKENCVGYPFCSYLDPEDYPEICTPTFSNCSTPVLTEQEIEVSNVENEVAEGIERDFPTEYAKLRTPRYCSLYTIDNQTGELKRDLPFMYNYMPFTFSAIPSPTFDYSASEVFVRQYNLSNEDCLYAANIININDPNLDVTSYIHNYKGADTLAGLQSTRNSLLTTGNFQSKITTSALWFKGNVNNREKFILEISKQNNVDGDDDIALGQTVRLDIFNGCSASTAVYSELVDLEVGVQYYVTMTTTGFTIENSNTGTVTTVVTSFLDGEFFVSIDIPTTSATVLANPDEDDINASNPADTTTRWHTAPTDGCFSIVTRNVEYKEIRISYDSITFKKKMVYSATCSFEVPQVQDCVALPYQFGKFAFTESVEEYPDNEELYNSSALRIDQTAIPPIHRTEFEDYFVSGLQEGEYILNSERTNFVCKKIKHFKFPDNQISPFMWENPQAPFVDSIIYPMGVTIDESLINSFLDIAVSNNLITQEQRDKIVGYEIMRGDRTLDKGIIAKGLMYDLMKYTENNRDIYYSNYPFNDLGSDKLNLLPDRSAGLPHPFLGIGNNKFTFHSPETDYNKLSLPNMLKVEGYMFGASKGYFDEVKQHPRWTILGRDAKRLANTLAIAEVIAEIAIQAAQAASNAQVWVVGGLGSTGASAGLPAFIASGAILALGTAEGIISKAGKYRYQWLETFRNLGTPRNFAYYYAAEGHYNYLQTLQEEGNMVRNLQIAKNIRPAGRIYVTNEVEGSRLEINNTDREDSVLISLGAAFPILYPMDYITYDNGSIDFNSSSRTYESESNVCKAGRSDELRKNIASMYVSLKNYLPSQYGTIGSIKWLTTGYRGDLENPKLGCVAIFGGDVVISRHTLKRKIPIFATTAMGEADLTPFEYKFYSNIGKEPKFFCDYEIDGGSDLSGTFFPDFDSNYEMDCLAGNNDFYVKPPSKFYLYYYGIPNFLTETEINTNYRTAESEPWNSFFPFTGDFMDWTQEFVVSIKRPNKFIYNGVYSKNVTPTTYRTLPVNYSKEEFDKKYDAPNGVMYSLPDNSENDSYDPWFIYRPLDFYQFPTDYGKLIELRGIETTQVLGRFENQTAIFNAVDVLVDGITPEQRSLGNGGIFRRRPVTFTETDLGYAGSQTSDMVSCEYGHFFVDAKRGQIFSVAPGGKGIEEISSYINGRPSGMSNWFKEHLPFKILKTVPDAEIDNPYNGLGVTMGWDSRYKRVFITKRDYEALDDCVQYNPVLGWVINQTLCGEDPIVTCPEGFVYNEETGLCERDLVIDKCPEGYTFNSETGLCEREGEDCPEGLDLVFILDATLSQDDAINNIKSAISTTIVPAIESKFGSNYRLGLVAIKDRRIAGQALFDILEPMTLTNETSFLTQMNTIVAAGGGAGAEPSDMALEAVLDNTHAIDLNGTDLGGNTIGTFRPDASKAIILVTDQRPSGLNDAYTFADWLHANSLALEAQNADINIYSYLTTPTAGAPVAPIPGDNNTPNVEYIMQNYANVTNGEYYFTPVGVGISDAVVDAIVNNIDCNSEVPPFDCTDCLDMGETCVCEETTEPTIVDVLVPISLEDETYFRDVSWTVAYSPILGSWLSFYDFKPNYYIGHNSYFQTGVNVVTEDFGLWSHLLTNKSFQVFYGKKYSFDIEYPVKSDMVTKQLNNVEMWTEAQRYHNDYDYAFSPLITFNKATVYNNVDNSGNLNLIPQKNNFVGNKNFPRTNSDNTQDILVSNVDNFKWSFDYIFNRVKSNLNNQPNWVWDRNQIKKTINPHAVGFGGKRVLQKLQGDYFINQLQYDKDSRFKVILKWGVAGTQV